MWREAGRRESQLVSEVEVRARTRCLVRVSGGKQEMPRGR